MNDCVVDTNVLVVANGGHAHASAACRLASINALRALLSEGRIAVDAAGEILAEYKRYCNPKGQPGVGDAFFREILTNYAGKVNRIELVKRLDGTFVDFPDDADLAQFDPSDRKFVAVAVVANAPVFNSTDRGWLRHRVALDRNGIQIVFVCTEQLHLWEGQ